MTRTAEDIESLERIVYLLAYKVEGSPAHLGVLHLLSAARTALRTREVALIMAAIEALEDAIDTIPAPAEPSGRKWYVARVSGGREKSVRRNLEHEFEDDKRLFYVPMEVRPMRVARRRRNVERALIPGYMFAELSEADFYRFQSVPGVHSLLSEPGMDGPRPKPAPPMFVAGLALAESLGAFDHSIDLAPKLKLKAGERVEITGSTFKGFTGEIVKVKSGAKRVRIMLDAMGVLGSAEHEIDASLLAPERPEKSKKAA